MNRAPTDREASTAAQGSERVGRQAMLYKKIVAVTDRPAPTCDMRCCTLPGRTFLRRMIALLAVAKKPHHRIRLNLGF